MDTEHTGTEHEGGVIEAAEGAVENTEDGSALEPAVPSEAVPATLEASPPTGRAPVEGLPLAEPALVEEEIAFEAAAQPRSTGHESGEMPNGTNRMPTLSQLAVALGALALIFGFSYLPLGTAAKEKRAEKKEEQPPERAEEISQKKFFENITISAESAYVWDIAQQRALYNKNAGKQLPLASLTKLMTALVAYAYLKPDDRIVIPASALLEEGDSSLATGEAFFMRDLADLTLLTSSNDGAHALAAAAGAAMAAQGGGRSFIDAMNAKAEEIGLSQSYFSNPTGLDVDGAQSGSYGSARDMAFLMEYLVTKHPEILEATKEALDTIYDREGALFKAHNTNELAAAIPGLIGGKTGFTNLAGGNLVVAYDAGLNHPIVIAVLGSSRQGRFTDVVTLIEETNRAIANTNHD